MATRRQQQTLDTILALHAELHYAPTLDEIAKASGISSRSTIHDHVQALIREGRLLEGQGKQAYQIPEELLHDGEADLLELPLLGKIAAGRPIEAIPNMTEINPSAMFQGEGRYVLCVQGDSMMDIGVMDGDFVVIKSQEEARNGDIVVALVNLYEVTLKRIFYLPNNQVELRPENRNFQSMIYRADQVKVQGKMVGMFRNYTPR